MSLDSEVHYLETKQKYLSYVSDCSEKLLLVRHCKHPIFRNIYNEIETTLKSANKCLAEGKKMEPQLQRIYDVFSLVEVDNTPNTKVIVKSTGKQLVACEDAFEILYTTHMDTNHGKITKMHCVLDKYYIYQKCLKYLLSSCSICTNEHTRRCPFPPSVPLVRKMNESCYAFIAYSPFEKYCLFQHILITVDKNTDFINIRPLQTIDIQDVALELLKIFTDTGFPKKLEAYEDRFFKYISSSITKALSNVRIPVEPINSSYDWISKVISEIKIWMDESENDNWVHGCLEVQYKINSSHIEGKGVPFKNVFKYVSPNDIFFTKTGAPEDSLKCYTVPEPFANYHGYSDRNIGNNTISRESINLNEIEVPTNYTDADHGEETPTLPTGNVCQSMPLLDSDTEP